MSRTSIAVHYVILVHVTHIAYFTWGLILPVIHPNVPPFYLLYPACGLYHLMEAWPGAACQDSVDLGSVSSIHCYTCNITTANTIIYQLIFTPVHWDVARNRRWPPRLPSYQFSCFGHLSFCAISVPLIAPFHPTNFISLIYFTTLSVLLLSLNPFKTVITDVFIFHSYALILPSNNLLHPQK